MKKQISGKMFTGSPGAEGGSTLNSIAVYIDTDCEGCDELEQLYQRYGRELFDNLMTGEEDPLIAFFSWSGQLYEFEGELDCESEEITINSFVEVKVVSRSKETLKAAERVGYAHCKEGSNCMYAFVDRDLQKSYEAGYAARYEEEQQLTNQCEEQENGN